MTPPKPISKRQTQSKPRLVTGVAKKEGEDDPDYSAMIIGLILLILIPGNDFDILQFLDQTSKFS